MEFQLDVDTYSKFENIEDVFNGCDRVHVPVHVDTKLGCFNNLSLEGRAQVPPPCNLLEGRRSLPTWGKRNEFLSALARCAVTVVTCGPGSQSATQLPQYVLEHSSVARLPCKMIFSQPHRLAAYSLAERVSRERGEALGSTVGYHMPLDSKYSFNVALIYCTNVMLKKTLMNRHVNDFAPITHLFVDDVRNEDKFLLHSLKLLLSHHPELKLVLITDDADPEWARSFFAEIATVSVPRPTVAAALRLYLDDMLKLIRDFGSEFFRKPQGSRAVQDDDYLDFSLILTIIDCIALQCRDTILVVVPSYKSAMICARVLSRDLTDRENLQVVALHDNVSIYEYQNALRSFEGKHKVIVADSEAVIGDVGFVIDCGRQERRIYDDIACTSSYQYVWITEDQADRRAAKCTLGNNPTCFHLYSRKQFELSDAKFGTPLYEMYLQANCLLPKFYLESSEGLFNNTTKHLIALEALNENRTVTALGKVLSQFSVEPRLAKMLCYGVALKCVDPVLTIVACLSYKTPFRPPRDAALDRDALDLVREMGGDHLSDHLFLLRAYQMWQSMAVGHKSVESNAFLDWDVMNIIHDIRGRLLSQLRGAGFITSSGDSRIQGLNANSDNWPLVKTALAAGYSGNTITSDHVVRYQKYSTITFSKVTNLNRQTCIVYERMVGREVQCGTVITPITVVLLGETVNIRPLRSSGDANVSQTFSNIIYLSWLFKLIVHKRILNPSYKLSAYEERVLQTCRCIIAEEEKGLFSTTPDKVGTFTNVRSKPTQSVDLLCRQTLNCAICPGERKTVYFVIKPPGMEWWTKALTSGTWRFAAKTEKRLFFYLKNQHDVKLFITVEKLNYFQGLAQLMDTNQGDVTQPCPIVLLSTSCVSFELVKEKNIRNPFKDHELVYMAEDGDEVEYWCAQQLSQLFKI